MWVWLDPQARTLVLDTGSQARADEVVSSLVEGLTGFALALVDTQTSAQAAMAHWLTTQESPADRKSTRLNSSHLVISYAVFCLKKKNNINETILTYARLHFLHLDYIVTSHNHSHIRVPTL